MNISMKLVYQYMAIFFTFPPTSNHLHPLQVENCGSNSRLVVDEDDNGKLRLERVKCLKPYIYKGLAGQGSIWTRQIWGPIIFKYRFMIFMI